jgi:hypothetical protein
VFLVLIGEKEPWVNAPAQCPAHPHVGLEVGSGVGLTVT